MTCSATAQPVSTGYGGKPVTECYSNGIKFEFRLLMVHLKIDLCDDHENETLTPGSHTHGCFTEHNFIPSPFHGTASETSYIKSIS